MLSSSICAASLLRFLKNSLITITTSGVVSCLPLRIREIVDGCFFVNPARYSTSPHSLSDCHLLIIFLDTCIFSFLCIFVREYDSSLHHASANLRHSFAKMQMENVKNENEILTNNSLKPMKHTPSQRLRQFRIAAELETEDLAELTGISKSLIEKMEAGAVTVSDKTAKTLKDKCKVPTEWLMHGQGEMKFELQPINPYRDYALKRLEGEVQFLRDMLKSFALSRSGNFRTALNGTGFHKRKSLGAAA